MSSFPLLPSQPPLPDGPHPEAPLGPSHEQLPAGGHDGGEGQHVGDEDLAVLLAAADDQLPDVPAAAAGLPLPAWWWESLDPEVLADPDLPEAAVAHVHACPRCQHRLLALGPELTGLTQLLGTLAAEPLPPAPDLAFPQSSETGRPLVPVPSDATAPGGTPVPALGGPGASVTPLPERRRPGLASAVWLRVAAVVVGVAAVGGLGLSVLRGTAQSGSASSGAAGASSGSSLDRGTSADSAGGGAASGAASALAAGPDKGTPGTLTAAAVHSTGTDYTPAGLPSQVAALLAASPTGSSAGATGGAGSGASGGTPATGGTAAGGAAPPVSAVLSRCVAQLAPGRPIAAIDDGRWQGEHALVVVARSGSNADVWVVAPDCGLTSAPTIRAHVVVYP